MNDVAASSHHQLPHQRDFLYFRYYYYQGESGDNSDRELFANEITPVAEKLPVPNDILRTLILPVMLESSGISIGGKDFDLDFFLLFFCCFAIDIDDTERDDFICVKVYDL